MEQSFHLTPDNGELLDDPSVYGQLIGCLIYLTITNLDITYLLNKLSQFMQKPKSSHMVAAYRILRYLKDYLDMEYSSLPLLYYY